MITLFPVDFIWPNIQTQEAQQIVYGDFQIEEIANFIQNDLQVGNNVYIYGDEGLQQILNNQYKLSQYCLIGNCNLYICINPQDKNNLIMVITQVDDLSEYEIQVDKDSAIYEIIITLQEQGLINGDIVSLVLQDPNGQLLATDQQMQFLNFPQFNKFHLYLYTQLPIAQTQTQKQYKPQTINKNEEAKELLKQLIVFPNLSILIDKDGEFVVYKYHFPLAINGYLDKKKAKLLQLNEANYDFKSQHNIKYALTDEYGLIICWGDSLYSKIRIKQLG